MGRGARWHLSWPLADTTAQKNLTTFLDSCMSSLLLQARNSSNFVRHPYAGALLPDLHTQTLSEKRVETGKSSGPCTVVIPVQSTAREFHTSLPCRRTSPLDTSCNSLLGNCTHKKNVISGAMLLEKKRKTRYVLSLYLPKHSNLTKINARLREHPQPTSRMPHCVACHPCR